MPPLGRMLDHMIYKNQCSTITMIMGMATG
jgi:hypothetical protein